MQHRTVADVMTHEVVKAHPDTTFKELIRLLADNDISAVPVVDDEDRPVGVVSEADLLRKEAGLADPEDRVPQLRMTPGQRQRAEACDAAGIMTRPVITARPEWNLVEATRVLVRHGVKRLVVVDEAGRLVGVASRADLLRVFLRSDTAIREEVVHDVLAGTLFLSPSEVQVTVHEGVVTLRGRVERKSLVPIAVRLVRAVDGVVDVHEALDYAFDERAPAGLGHAG